MLTPIGPVYHVAESHDTSPVRRKRTHRPFGMIAVVLCAFLCAWLFLPPTPRNTLRTANLTPISYDTVTPQKRLITKNIEEIEVGDHVYSYNSATDEYEYSAVTKTKELTSNHISRLTIVDENDNKQTLETTDGHPFWVVTNAPDLSRAARSVIDENGVWLYHDNIAPTEHGYWVEAKDLRVGDTFLGADGKLSTLVSRYRVEKSGGIAVFNFTVEGNHDYFVLAKDFEYGQTCVLVHNGRCVNGETSHTSRGREAHENYKKALGHGYVHQYTLPSGRRPDAVNFALREVRELKPDNVRAIREGNKQAQKYAKELGELYPDVNGMKTPFSVKIDTYRK